MDQVKIFNNELSSLYESKPPISKAKMTQLTRSAIKGIKFYKHVVQSVEKFIQKCRPEYKVPGLYVIDSIVRQSRHQFGYDRDVFVPRFSKNIVATFQCLYKCPSEEKPKIVKVLNLWQKNNVFATEIIQPLLDMANIETPETKPKLSTDETQLKSWGTSNQASDGPSNNATHNKEGGDEAPVLDSAIISQLQELTSQLLNNPKSNDSQLKQENAVKFNKKLLDFDYGDEEEEPEDEEKEENGNSATTTEPTAIALSMAQNLLSNPELLRQLQQMQQTIQQTEALKNELSLTERKNEELQQPQSSQHVAHLQQQQQEAQIQHQMFQETMQQQQPQQVLDNNFNHQKLTQQNFHDVAFPVAHPHGLHPDVSMPISQPQLAMMGNQSHNFNSPLFLPQQQNFSPAGPMLVPHMAMDQNFNMNQAMRGNNRMGINTNVIDMDHSLSSLPENPSQLMHDQDERQMWNIHTKDPDERERSKKDRSRSRSRSRSPRNRSKSSRKHKRSRSRSPKRRRSSSRSPSRHRRDKRSDSKDFDRDRDGDRDRERDREREKDRERDKEKEKDRERRKKGLPPIRKNYLAVCTTTLWLGHVPKMVPENDIKETFAEYGTVSSVDLIPPRGCAYICMAKRQDAAKCLNRLRNLKFQGSSIKMAWAPGKGVKGKEYKSFWDVEQGVTYIPYDKLPEKSKVNDLAEGGTLDEESVPDNMKDIIVKEETPNVAPSEIALPNETEPEKNSQVSLQVPSMSKVEPGLIQQPHTQAQSKMIVSTSLQSQAPLPSLPSQPDQGNLMAGTPIHMPMMTTMPPQFSLGLPGMVGPQVQPMLIPQIPLPMGVPPPNQIMMMNPGALMNAPSTMAVMNSVQNAIAAASLQAPHLVTPVSGINLPTNNIVATHKPNESDQMEENSDATPTEEDQIRSSQGDNNTSVDMDISRSHLVKTNTSLPSNFPSNPPTSIPISFSTAFPPNNNRPLIVTSAPSLPPPGHLLGVPPSQNQPWPPNPNGPNLFRMQGGMPMQQFNHLPPSPNNPPLINQGMPPPSFVGPGGMRMPNNNMGAFPPSPNLISPEGRNSKPGMSHKITNNSDEFDPNISANCVPLGRPRINFGSQNSPQMQNLNNAGNGPNGMAGPPLRMLGPPPPDNRGPPQMIVPNQMRMPPPPQEMGFRPQRPLLGNPTFGVQGPPRGPGNRFPFGHGQDGPMGQRPFLMRGPPGIVHRMEFHGPPPEFLDERFAPDFRGRPPFPGALDRDPFFEKNDVRNMEFPPEEWEQEQGDEMARGRRVPDGRRPGFRPQDERGWNPDGIIENEEFGGPRDQFDGGRGFDDRRRMMGRGDRDRGRFGYGGGPRDRDRDREWDRDRDRDVAKRRDNDSDGGRNGDKRSSRERRDRKETRWNRSRSRSREPKTDLAKNGELSTEEEKEVLIIREGSSPKQVEVIDVEPIIDGSPPKNEPKFKPIVECVENSVETVEEQCGEKIPSENNTPVKDEVSPSKEDVPLVEC